jgi:hypothetical protein
VLVRCWSGANLAACTWHAVPVRFIAVAGSCPGIGKSTLCGAIVGWLAGVGLRVDHFEEEQVLSRPQFAQVAAEFTGTGVVESASFVDATVRYLADVAAAGTDVAVTDALVPWVPSLLAFGHSEQSVNRVLDEFAGRIASTPTVVVYLDGDADAALSRAVEREGPGWLDWFGAKLARYGRVTPDHTRADICDYLAQQRATELRVLKRQPWDLLIVENADELSPDAVLRTVRDRLAEFVAAAERLAHQAPAVDTTPPPPG